MADGVPQKPQDDGGHAWEQSLDIPGLGKIVTHAGMSLLDYFAAEAKLAEDEPWKGLAEALMGGVTPGVNPSAYDEVLAGAKWWARAEARYRYLKAEAMVEEHNRRMQR